MVNTAYDEKITATSSQTLAAANKLVLAVGGTDGIVITLFPASPGESLAVTVLKTDAGAGTVTVVGDGVSKVLTTENESASFFFAGSSPWVVFAASSSGGGGGTPGAPPLSVQGASADGLSLVGIPNSTFDPVTGDVTLGAGLTVNDSSIADSFALTVTLTTTNPNAYAAAYFSNNFTDDAGSGTPGGISGVIGAAGALGSNVEGDFIYGVSGAVDNDASGGNLAELTTIYVQPRGGVGLPPVIVTGVHVRDQNIVSSPASSVNAGILIDDQTLGANVYAIKTGLGPVSFGDGLTVDASATTNPINLTSASGVSITDNSAGGIAVVESGAGPFTYNGNPILTALTGVTSAIGGSALTLGQQATTTVSITGASAAIAAGAVVQVTPTGNVGNGFVWTGSLTAADTITVKVICIVAGTPASSTYNVKVF